jgi:hypothetical protein
MQLIAVPAARRPRQRQWPLALGLFLLGSAASSYAFDKIDSDSELFVTGTASAQENDNIFLSHSNATSDTVFDFIPGLELDFGKDSLTKGFVSASEDISAYASHSDLDTGLAHAALSADYDNDKSKLNFDANFDQANQATRDIRGTDGLVLRDLYHVGALGEVAVSDKSTLGAGVNYDDTQFKAAGYTDWQWVQVPLKYYFKVEPKLDISAGFTYQDNTVGPGAIDSTEYFYNIGARGEFTPKLTGELNVGYEQIDFDRGGGNKSGVGVNSKFTYNYSPKTIVYFGATNDFGYAAIDGAFRDFTLYGGMTSALTEQWKFNILLNYGYYDYIRIVRIDDLYSGQVGLTYIVNTYLSLVGTYKYAENSSSLAPDSFTNNIFSVAATVKF